MSRADCVCEGACERCDTMPSDSPQVEIAPLVVEDLAARVQRGWKTYGRPLTTHDNRDGLWDAYEEALDLVLYLRKELEERHGK